jgi:ABC-type enterochelin transport system ATPase subunit
MLLRCFDTSSIQFDAPHPDVDLLHKSAQNILQIAKNVTRYLIVMLHFILCASFKYKYDSIYRV